MANEKDVTPPTLADINAKLDQVLAAVMHNQSKVNDTLAKVALLERNLVPNA